MSAGDPEHIPIGLNRDALWIRLLAHVLFGKPVSTPDQVRGRPFPGHALASQETAVRWVILAIFLFGMFSLLNWHEAVTKEGKIAYGLMAVTALALVLLLGNTMF
jgi:hypothetical protein